MRGAPHVGFSATIRKIKARTSLLTCFRPPICLTLETHVQYKRNPARCQFTTVLEVTKMRGFLASSTRTRTFSTQPRTACGGQSIVGEDVARAEPTIADGEPGFRGRDPPGNGKRSHPAEEVSERRDHSQNLIGQVRFQLFAKSFILQVYDVLARHTVRFTRHDFPMAETLSSRSVSPETNWCG